jgi:hypothetical protein
MRPRKHAAAGHFVHERNILAKRRRRWETGVEKRSATCARRSSDVEVVRRTSYEEQQ